MFQQTYAIARNTFFESIRQPIMLVVLLIATIAIVLSNPLAAFTMEDDQRMLIDLGLATVFLCGCLLAAFIATNVLGREIDNRTVLTVVSKPVSRPLFVLGKFLGVAAAMTLGTLYMSIVFMITEQHTVLQTARSPLHGPVLVFSFTAFVLGVGAAVWCNFFYGKVFASTVLVILTPLAALAYLFSMMFTAEFKLQPISIGFKPQLWLAIITLWMAILILTAIALAVSTRLGQVMTLVITLGVFIMGMLSDWTLGRPMVKIEETWTQRVRSMTGKEVEGLLGPENLEPLRKWIRDNREAEAYHREKVGPCRLQTEVGKIRGQLKVESESDRMKQIEAMTATITREVAERLQTDLTAAKFAADNLQWPPNGEDMVLALDWPQIIIRASDECETIPNTRTLVFPPAERAVRQTSERLTYFGCVIGRAVLPNFQVMFLSDALTQDHRIPVSYVFRTLLYGVLYIGAALALATFLFQTREVG